MSDHLVTVNCGGCGIEFGLPSLYAEGKIRYGKSVRCPNGHKVWLFKDDPPPDPKAEATKTKRRLKLLELHLQEQAEARQRDQKSAA